MNVCAYRIVAVLAALVPGWSAPALSQQFPERTVRIVVPYAGGTAPDVTVRLLADRLTSMWNHPVIVDNRPGAAGTVAAMEVKRAKPDGHDWFIGDTGSLVTSALITKDLPFDPEKDFVAVTQLTRIFFYIVVGADSRIKTVADLIAGAKAQPGKLTFGSNGMGSPQHFGWELVKLRAGIDMVHIPFKGGPPILLAVASEEVTGFMTGYNVARPMMAAGKLRPLPVISKTRDSQHPEVPTVEESGGPAGLELKPWTAVVVLSATPQSTINKIHRDVVQVLRRPDVNERLLQTGNLVVGDTPDEVAAQIRLERAQYRDVIASMKEKSER